MKVFQLARSAYVEVLRHVCRNHPIGWYLGAPQVVNGRTLIAALRRAKQQR